MPYQYVSSRCLPKTVTTGWVAPSVSNVRIDYLYRDYRKVYVELRHTSTGDRRYWIDLFSILESIPAVPTTRTLNSWLSTQIGNRTLTTQSDPPATNINYLHYYDAWLEGFKVEPGKLGSTSTDLPESEKTDLILTRPQFPYQTSGRGLLGVVNGFVHRVSVSENNIVIRQGNTTGRIAKANHVGLLDFSRLGGIRTFSLTPAMLTKPSSDRRLYDGLFIALPESVENKTVVLSIGGILHWVDQEAISLQSPKSLLIRPNRMNLAERLFYSQHFIDLSRLRIHEVKEKPQMWETKEVWDNETVLGYLTLSQSFLIIIDTPNYYLRQKELETVYETGRYIGEAPCPNLPMIGRMGTLVNYHPRVNSGETLYWCPDQITQNYTSLTTHWNTNLGIDDRMFSGDRWDYTRARLLEFGTY